MAILCAAGCTGCDEEEKDATESGPIVGPLELPISHRNADDPPPNPLKMEIGTSELRVAGEKALSLEGGKVPSDERAEDHIPTLVEAVRGAGTRGGAAIRAHVSTPYRTTVLVLGSLRKAGLEEAAFEVRKGNGPETGWLRLSEYRLAPPSKEPVEFRGEAQRQWDEVAAAWETMYQACRRGPRVDCDYLRQNVAEGGKAQMTLWVRGSALKVKLERFGAPEPEEEKKKAGGAGGGGFIEGVNIPTGGGGEEEEGPPPATDAVFTWRYQAAVDDVSSLSDGMKPLCGSTTCGAVVSTEAGTPTMRVLSFVGAAFPNGAPRPQLHLEIPER